MGCLLEDSERYEEAIENFRLAYELDAHNTYTGICLARCYIAVKELSEARRILKEISSNGELFSEGYYLLGISYMLEEKFSRAIPYLKRASKSEPDELTNSLALASCYAETEREDIAFSLFAECIKNPSFTEYWSEWIMMFYLSGHDTLADEARRIVLNAYPDMDLKIDQLNCFIEFSENQSEHNKSAVLSILMNDYEEMFAVFKKNFPELLEKHQEISDLNSYFENYSDDEHEPGTI
jgi:tetratricopeptide (TPR) repeat protein